MWLVSALFLCCFLIWIWICNSNLELLDLNISHYKSLNNGILTAFIRSSSGVDVTWHTSLTIFFMLNPRQIGVQRTPSFLVSGSVALTCLTYLTKNFFLHPEMGPYGQCNPPAQQCAPWAPCFVARPVTAIFANFSKSRCKSSTSLALAASCSSLAWSCSW